MQNNNYNNETTQYSAQNQCVNSQYLQNSMHQYPENNQNMYNNYQSDNQQYTYYNQQHMYNNKAYNDNFMYYNQYQQQGSTYNPYQTNMSNQSTIIGFWGIKNICSLISAILLLISVTVSKFFYVNGYEVSLFMLAQWDSKKKIFEFLFGGIYYSVIITLIVLMIGVFVNVNVLSILAIGITLVWTVIVSIIFLSSKSLHISELLAPGYTCLLVGLIVAIVGYSKS